MSEQIQNNTKDINANFQNNISKENQKNQNPLYSINSNINQNFNSYQQENLVNELINSTNYQESKGNSSFYNFSESIQSNQDNINSNQNNTNIVMNKEQLYQTFLLFQKFLSQNMNSNNTISSNKNKNKIENNYKNNSSNDEVNEIYNFNKNENVEIYNGKDISENNKINQINKNSQNQFQNDENLNNNIHKEMIQSKSHYNIINGGSDKIIFYDENESKNIDKLNDINTNINYQRRNSSDLNNKVIKNSYDDIPIKFNKENFIDLVEKKLADEKKYGHMSPEIADNKFEILHKIKPRKQSENIAKKNKNKNKIKKEKNKINDAKEIVDKDKKDEIPDIEKNNIEKKLKVSERKKNNINNNYSFDKEVTHTHILNDNKIINNFENSSTLDNLANIINKSDKNQNPNITSNDNNINLSKENLNKLLLNNIKENLKNYKINKFEICLMNNREKKTNESEAKDTNSVDQKEELVNQKMKEINKEMVKLKEERNKANKLRMEYEKSLSKLNNDLYQFNQKKEEFEKYRKNEINKIKNDKKNILIESKNIKDIKSQNQLLIMKAKKDKDNIDELKSKISDLQSLLKQKEKMNNLTGSCNNNTFKLTNKKNSKNKMNNVLDLDIDSLKSNNILDGYYGKINNNSIRSMTNINNIFSNAIEDKLQKRFNSNNNNIDQDLENNSVTLKRNNSSNKNYGVISKKIEVIKNTNKNINNNNLINSNSGTLIRDKNLSSNNINEIRESLSLSKKMEKNQKSLMGNKDIINDRIIFSPQASRTSIGFDLKKLNIKITNTPKENLKVTKKIFENKNKQNTKKHQYSKTMTNNLSGSLINNINYESNQNSYSNNLFNNNYNNNKINSKKKKLARHKLSKGQNTNDVFNNKKISKIVISTQNYPKNNNIIKSKSKVNLFNKSIKNKKNDLDILNNNINDKSNDNNKKRKTLNNKSLTKDNISRNFNSQNNNEKINITESNLSNKRNCSSLINKDKEIHNKEDEYDFVIPKKYLDKEYKLIKSLKTDDKEINLYTNGKKEIIFKSGVRKELYQDGHQIIYFVNGDRKQIYPDGKTYYFFNDSKTVQITLNNGLEIYKFEDGQIEKHYPDGTKQILFNDGSERYIYSDGYEETYFSDGNVEKVDKKRNVIIEKLLDNEEDDEA